MNGFGALVRSHSMLPNKTCSGKGGTSHEVEESASAEHFASENEQFWTKDEHFGLDSVVASLASDFFPDRIRG